MPMMEADDLESDDIVRMDTNAMTSDEIDVVQTQLDELKVEKADLEKKEEALKNSAAAFSLNDDTLTESKSVAASKVLQLMDKDYSYQKALSKVLADNPALDKTKLEQELDAYI